ncbi:MAG: LPS export ABC transporter periplasmic protein LptC [Massilia sp.]
MHKRVAHRWRLTAVMTVGVLFSVGSFYLVQLAGRDDVALPPDALKTEPDYIVEKFSFVRMDPNGRPRYIIAGDKLTHRPIDDIAEVEQPVVNSLTAERARMTMRARRARIDQTNSVIDLKGAVAIDRLPSALGKPMTLRTEALTLYTDEDRMETEQPFKLVIGTQTVTGVGMQANNATGRFKVKNNMQLDLAPRGR